MKYLFLVLLFATATLSAAAQNPQVNSSSRPDKENDTTLNGLPVHRSYVPADVVERAKKKYGRSLYSIEKSQAPNCRESYLVGLIRNGRLVMEWMCDDPKIV